MEKNFVAIDFETATSSRMACQLGIVVVKNGEIIECKEFLIQPPNNYYEANVMKYHHVTPEMTKGEPTFEELWPEIKSYFTTLPIYAHNAPFDSDVLFKNLAYYNIPCYDIYYFSCTCSAFNNTSLMHLCIGFGIPYDAQKHHGALYDAERCADFALKQLQGIEPDWNKIDEYKKSKDDKIAIRMGMRRKSLHGDVLKKDLTGANPDNPFYDRKVVITGEFGIERSELGGILKKLGADIDTGITRKTNYVLTGMYPGPAKMKKLTSLIEEGYDIKRVEEGELLKILTKYAS